MGREYRVLSNFGRSSRWRLAYLFPDDVNIAGEHMFVMERRVGEVMTGSYLLQ